MSMTSVARVSIP